MNSNPIKGLGLGLRFDHFDEILESTPEAGWFEVILEDFLDEGPHHRKLEKLRELYPITLHSIGLNLGGVEAYEQGYLESVKALYDRFEPNWISDHLCWSAHGGKYHHDLLPIPRTKEGLLNICERIDLLQSFFKRQLCLENITSYIDYQENDYDEIEFINEIVSKTGCSLLLDISNVLINHKNRKVCYADYLERFPIESVKQIHLAGGTFDGEMIIDSHSGKVESEDIGILRNLYQNGYDIPAMIERDSDIPLFAELELERKSIEREVYGL